MSLNIGAWTKKDSYEMNQYLNSKKNKKKKTPKYSDAQMKQDITNIKQDITDMKQDIQKILKLFGTLEISDE